MALPAISAAVVRRQTNFPVLQEAGMERKEL